MIVEVLDLSAKFLVLIFKFANFVILDFFRSHHGHARCHFIVEGVELADEVTAFGGELGVPNNSRLLCDEQGEHVILELVTVLVFKVFQILLNHCQVSNELR